MKTLFIGSTRRGFMTLEALIASEADVVGVISLLQDNHETDRFEGQIRALAQERSIPLLETRFLREPSISEWVRSKCGAEVAFAVGVRVLMPPELFDAFPRGCWAVHDSLLPAYRGFAALNWAIINGEDSTGVTLFRVTSGVDTGEVMIQRRIPMGKDETAPEVYKKVCDETVKVVLESQRLIRTGTASPRQQDHSRATYLCSRNPGDGLIDWSKSTREIHNLIRGLTFPYPGAFTFHGGHKLLVLSSEIVGEQPKYVGRIPGRVVRVEPGMFVDVLTGDGILRITEVSLDERERLNSADVIKSVRARLGFETAPVSNYAPKPSKS